MSCFSVIRKATDEDVERLYNTALRFWKRHIDKQKETIDTADIEYLESYIQYSNEYNASYISKLWTACKCRALKVRHDKRVGIAWGNVGVWLD